MLKVIELFFTFMRDLYITANVPVINGVGFMDLAVAFLVVSMVVSVFWKGARA